MVPEDSLSDRLERLITATHTDPGVALTLILELVADVRKTARSLDGKLSALEQTVAVIGNDVESVKNLQVGTIRKDVEMLKKNWLENPSLLFLLRYKTVPTVTAIVLIYAFLSFILVSDFRSIVFDLIGISPIP